MDQTPQPEFKIEDAARIIGNLMIENDVLRRGLQTLREETEQAKMAVEELMQRPKGPTLAVVERAEDPDAATPGQT